MTRVSHPMFYSQFVIFSGVRAQKTYIFDFTLQKKIFPREKFIRFFRGVCIKVTLCNTRNVNNHAV